jgi:hypothetical protein
LQETAAALNQAVRPTDAVITNDPEIALPLAELYKGRAPVLGLNQAGLPLPEAVARRLAQIVANHTQVWWLPNWLPPPNSGVEQTLLAQGFQVRNDNLAGQRLVLFAYPKQLAVEERLTGTVFAEVIHLTQAAYTPKLEPGSAFLLELHWQTVMPLSEAYHVFIHLLDEQGQIIAQADSQPGQWTRPTPTWRVGETIVDRHGLWLPAEMTPGDYHLLVGLYRPVDGRRLLLADGADSVRLDLQIE